MAGRGWTSCIASGNHHIRLHPGSFNSCKHSLVGRAAKATAHELREGISSGLLQFKHKYGGEVNHPSPLAVARSPTYLARSCIVAINIDLLPLDQC